MDWLRKYREIAALRRRLTEIQEELDLIQRTHERVTTKKKALLIRQKQLVLNDLVPLIENREEVIKTMAAAKKLEFAERTNSYKNLRDDIDSDRPVREILKPLLLEELKGLEFCLKLEKDSIRRRITILRLWTRNPLILFAIVTTSFLVFGYSAIVRSQTD